MKKEIGEKAGLVFTGKNFEGENEFIGTEQEWNEAERLEAKEEAIDDERKQIQEESLSLCCSAPIGEKGFCYACGEHSDPVNYGANNFDDFVSANPDIDQDLLKDIWDENVSDNEGL